MEDIDHLQNKINELEKQLAHVEVTNKKLMGAAHRALVTDKIENSVWLKDNVRLPASFFRPAIERQMKIEFDGDEFKVINVDAKGDRMLSYELSGLYPNSDEAIKRIIMEMPDYKTIIKESEGGHTPNNSNNHSEPLERLMSAHASNADNHNVRIAPVHSGQRITRADFDARTPTDKINFARNGGTII